jgi:signal peptidase II
MSQSRKYAVFIGVTAVLLALDLGTKSWAELNLGDIDHPLPIHVTSEEAGRTVAEVLGQRFPALAGDADAVVRSRVTKVDTSVDVGRDTPVFGEGSPRATGYWTFSRGSLDLPPRRLPKIEQPLMERWLQLAAPDAAPSEVRRVVEGSLQSMTLAEWLGDRVPYLEADNAGPIADALTFPYVQRMAEVDPDARVEAGDVYLLTERTIEVIPNFFQLVYAENPGAAWGFLGGAHEDFRRTFFLFVSLLALVVIGYFAYRLEPGDWLPLVAFANVLSGALGNSVDRYRFNYVIDFLDMYVGTSHWPTYNVADIAISVGVGLLLFEMLIRKKSPLFSDPPDPAVRTPVA